MNQQKKCYKMILLYSYRYSYSASQWNAPLVILKKSDASGKQKFSGRFHETGRINNRRLISSTKHNRHFKSGNILVRKRQIFLFTGFSIGVSLNF